MATRATERMTRVRSSLLVMLIKKTAVMLRKMKKSWIMWKKSRSRRLKPKRRR